MRQRPFFIGRPPGVLLFCDQKRSRKVPLLPGRGARLKGAWVRALRERFASAPLRIQERTHWPLPGANTLRWDDAKFLLFVAAFRWFVGGGVLDAPGNLAIIATLLSFVGADSISARAISRCHQIPRANTVRPYAPLPIGTVGRGLDPSGAKINSMRVELKAPLCKGSWLRDSAD